MAEFSTDGFFNGRLNVSQSLNGYRFSIDAVLLAAAVQPEAGETVLDLGTGCGIIPLILAMRHPEVSITGIEIQDELAMLAQRNIEDNHFEGRITVRNMDLNLLPDRGTTGPFDWVVSNPPYRCPRTCRINPDEQKATARFELKIDLAKLLQASGRILRSGGRFVTIFTAERAVDLFVQMRQAEIEPQSIQPVQSYAGEVAKLVLVKGIKRGTAGLRIEPALVVHERGGTYSEKVQEMMRP